MLTGLQWSVSQALDSNFNNGEHEGIVLLVYSARKYTFAFLPAPGIERRP